MDVAVGRLQFSVRLAEPKTPKRVAPPAAVTEDMTQIFEQERRLRAVESDRERWSREQFPGGHW
jgi:hypothetical protein